MAFVIMAPVESRDYLLSGLRCGPALKPALVQRLVFAGLRSIAAGLVVLTAGGDYKLTLTQCPFSPGQYFMLAGAEANSAWRAAAGSKMEVSAYFTSVHIPYFGRAVTGNATDSKMEVSAHFTSVHIPSYRMAMTGTAANSEMAVSAYFTSVHILSFARAVTGKKAQ